jgi:hypothetical protein
MACLVKGEVVHVLEAADQADWRSKLVEYSNYALKNVKNKDELCSIICGYGPGKQVKPVHSGSDVRGKNGLRP